jgi:hypothetical protein
LTNLKRKATLENNIKIDLKETGFQRLPTGFTLVRMGFNDGAL